jgi:alkyldihydroxyacetonephosphate synthase
MDLEALRASGIRTSSLPLDTDAYRRDLWPRDTLRMYRGRELPDAPRAVVWPENEEQVAQAITWAEREGVPVVPYGAGSGVCGGASGQAGSLVVDTKRMCRVLEVDTASRLVRVEAGMLGQHLEDALEPTGWMTAHSPSSIMCSTVGGYVAARSAGQFSSRYGVFSDMLHASRTITPSGPVMTGSWANSQDEDLQPVICGSEGTLGIVTEALIRLSPLPRRRWLRGYAFSDLDSAWAAMRGLMQAGLWPSVLRLYDPADTRIGGRAKAGGSAESGSIFGRIRRAVSVMPGVAQHMLDLPLALPGLVNRLVDGLGEEVLLIVGFDGDEQSIPTLVAHAASHLEAGRDLGAEPGEHWLAHRHEVSYKLAPIFAGGGFADTMEVAAPWSSLPRLYTQVRAAIAEHGVVMAHFSHAYPEGCSIYFSFAGRDSLDTYDQLWSDGLAAATAAGGTVTHHHGVGQLKALPATHEKGAAIEIWSELQAQLDPRGTMNPDRLFVEGIPPLDGPPSPSGGPVFEIDKRSRLATVDPRTPPDRLASALAEHGFKLRHAPNQPLLTWLGGLRPSTLRRFEDPLFSVQARMASGQSVSLGRAPRSAAGPDLRWALLRRATVESVEVSVLPIGQSGDFLALSVDADLP